MNVTLWSMERILVEKKKSIFQNIDDLIAPSTSEECDDHRRHSGNRYQCKTCPKSYVTPLGLSKHSKVHLNGDEAHECEHCGKKYKSFGALKMHVKTHTLPCVCEHCGKSFSRPWLLKGHQRTHTGEKPFECGDCGRKFADRSNLRAHELTHKSERKYRCRGCGTSFSRSQVRAKHEGNCTAMDALDTEESSRKCDDY